MMVFFLYEVAIILTPPIIQNLQFSPDSDFMLLQRLVIVVPIARQLSLLSIDESIWGKDLTKSKKELNVSTEYYNYMNGELRNKILISES